jgi:hypothetical protein
MNRITEPSDDLPSQIFGILFILFILFILSNVFRRLRVRQIQLFRRPHIIQSSHR